MAEQIAIMSTSFGAIRDNIILAMGIIAPIAITILGIFIIWAFATSFFKRMSH